MATAKMTATIDVVADASSIETLRGELESVVGQIETIKKESKLLIGVDRSQIEAAEASLANLRKNRGSTLYGVDARNATIVPQEYERIGRALKDPEQISKVAKELYEKEKKIVSDAKISSNLRSYFKGIQDDAKKQGSDTEAFEDNEVYQSFKSNVTDFLKRAGVYGEAAKNNSPNKMEAFKAIQKDIKPFLATLFKVKDDLRLTDKEFVNQFSNLSQEQSLSGLESITSNLGSRYSSVFKDRAGVTEYLTSNNMPDEWKKFNSLITKFKDSNAAYQKMDEAINRHILDSREKYKVAEFDDTELKAQQKKAEEAAREQAARRKSIIEQKKREAEERAEQERVQAEQKKQAELAAKEEARLAYEAARSDAKNQHAGGLAGALESLKTGKKKAEVGSGSSDVSGVKDRIDTVNQTPKVTVDIAQAKSEILELQNLLQSLADDVTNIKVTFDSSGIESLKGDIREITESLQQVSDQFARIKSSSVPVQDTDPDRKIKTGNTAEAQIDNSGFASDSLTNIESKIVELKAKLEDLTLTINTSAAISALEDVKTSVAEIENAFNQSFNNLDFGSVFTKLQSRAAELRTSIEEIAQSFTKIETNGSNDLAAGLFKSVTDTVAEIGSLESKLNATQIDTGAGASIGASGGIQQSLSQIESKIKTIQAQAKDLSLSLDTHQAEGALQDLQLAARILKEDLGDLKIRLSTDGLSNLKSVASNLKSMLADLSSTAEQFGKLGDNFNFSNLEKTFNQIISPLNDLSAALKGFGGDSLNNALSAQIKEFMGQASGLKINQTGRRRKSGTALENERFLAGDQQEAAVDQLQKAFRNSRFNASNIQVDPTGAAYMNVSWKNQKNELVTYKAEIEDYRKLLTDTGALQEDLVSKTTTRFVSRKQNTNGLTPTQAILDAANKTAGNMVIQEKDIKVSSDGIVSFIAKVTEADGVVKTLKLSVSDLWTELANAKSGDGSSVFTKRGGFAKNGFLNEGEVLNIDDFGSRTNVLKKNLPSLLDAVGTRNDQSLMEMVGSISKQMNLNGQKPKDFETQLLSTVEAIKNASDVEGGDKLEKIKTALQSMLTTVGVKKKEQNQSIIEMMDIMSKWFSESDAYKDLTPQANAIAASSSEMQNAIGNREDGQDSIVKVINDLRGRLNSLVKIQENRGDGSEAKQALQSLDSNLSQLRDKLITASDDTGSIKDVLNSTLSNIDSLFRAADPETEEEQSITQFVANVKNILTKTLTSQDGSSLTESLKSGLSEISASLKQTQQLSNATSGDVNQIRTNIESYFGNENFIDDQVKAFRYFVQQAEEAERKKKSEAAKLLAESKKKQSKGNERTLDSVLNEAELAKKVAQKGFVDRFSGTDNSHYLKNLSFKDNMSQVSIILEEAGQAAHEITFKTKNLKDIIDEFGAIDLSKIRQLDFDKNGIKVNKAQSKDVRRSWQDYENGLSNLFDGEIKFGNYDALSNLNLSAITAEIQDGSGALQQMVILTDQAKDSLQDIMSIPVGQSLKDALANIAVPKEDFEKYYTKYQDVLSAVKNSSKILSEGERTKLFDDAFADAPVKIKEKFQKAFSEADFSIPNERIKNLKSSIQKSLSTVNDLFNRVDQTNVPLRLKENLQNSLKEAFGGNLNPIQPLLQLDPQIDQEKFTAAIQKVKENIKSEIDKISNSLSGENGQTINLDAGALEDQLRRIQSIESGLRAIRRSGGAISTRGYSPSRLINSDVGKINVGNLESFVRSFKNAENKVVDSITRIRESNNKLYADLTVHAAGSNVYENIRVQLENLQGQSEQAQVAVSEMVRGTRTVLTPGQQMLESYKNKVSQLFTYLSGMDIARMAYRSIKSGFGFTKELDSLMTTIRQTTDISETGLKQISQGALDQARALGVQTQKVTGAIDIYASMGETAESLLSKSAPTTMLAKAAGMEITQASDVVQGVTQQFTEYQGQEASVVNTLEKISSNMKMNFGTGIQNMAEGIQNAGSIAKESGMGFELLAASIGKISEVTRQDGSQVGTALKTMMARVSRAKDADNDVTAADRSDAAAALKKFANIDVYDASGNYKDLSLILDEVSAKYDKFTDAQKANVAEAFGGVRGVNNVKILLSNWKQIRELEKSALNDTDFYQEVQEKSMDSFQSKIDQLSATGDDLFYNLLNTDVLKGGISSLTGLIGIFDKLIATINKMPALSGMNYLALLLGGSTLLGGWDQGFSTYMSKVNQGQTASLFSEMFNGIKTSVKALPTKGISRVMQETYRNKTSNDLTWLNSFAAGVNANSSLRSRDLRDTENLTNVLTASGLKSIPQVFKEIAAGSGSATQKITLMFTALSNGAKTAWASLSGMSKFLIGGAGLVMAFNVGKSLVDHFSTSIDEAKEKINSLNQDMSYQRDQAKSLKEFVDSPKGTRLNELTTKMSRSEALNVGELEEYHSLCNEVADIMPDLVAGFDSQNNAILNLTTTTAGLNAEYERMQLNMAQQRISQGSDRLKLMNQMTGNKSFIDEFVTSWNGLWDGNSVDSALAGMDNSGGRLNTLRKMEELQRKHEEGKKITKDDLEAALPDAKYQLKVLAGIDLDFSQSDADVQRQIDKMIASGEFKNAIRTVDASLSEAYQETQQIMYDSLAARKADGSLDVSDQTISTVQNLIARLGKTTLPFKEGTEITANSLGDYISEMATTLDDTPALQDSLDRVLSFDMSKMESVGQLEIIIADLKRLSSALNLDYPELTSALGLSGIEQTTSQLKNFRDLSKAYYVSRPSDKSFDEYLKNGGSTIDRSKYLPLNSAKDKQNRHNSAFYDQIEAVSKVFDSAKKAAEAQTAKNKVQKEEVVEKVSKKTVEKKETETKKEAVKPAQEDTKGVMSAISMFEKMEGFTSDIYTEQRELNIAIKSNTNAVSKNTNQSKASTKEAEKILDLRPQKTDVLHPNSDKRFQSNSKTAEALNKHGWQVKSEYESGFFARTFSSDDGSRSVVMTPVLPDGTVLSPEELQKYASSVLANEQIDVDGITLGMWEGKDSVRQAKGFARSLAKAAKSTMTMDDYIKSLTRLWSSIDMSKLDASALVAQLDAAKNAGENLKAVVDSIVAKNYDKDFMQGRINDLWQNTTQAREDLKTVWDARSEENTSSGLTKSTMDAIDQVYNRANLQTYEYDKSKLFGLSADSGIQINDQELRKLDKAWKTEQLEKYTNTVKDLENQYQELCLSIGEAGGMASDSMLQQRDSLKEQILEAKTAQAEFEGLTSAVTEFKQAGSMTQSYDTYSYIQGKQKSMDELNKKHFYGNTEYQKYIEMFSNPDTDFSTWTGQDYADAYAEASRKSKRYITEDMVTGVSNFVNDLINSGADYATGSLTEGFEINASAQDIAKKLNISESAVDQIFKAFEGLGIPVEFTINSSIKNLYDDAKAAATKLGHDFSEIDVNGKSYDEIAKKLQEVTAKKKECEAQGLLDQDEANAYDAEIKYLTAALGELQKSSGIDLNFNVKDNFADIEKNILKLRELNGFDIDLHFDTKSTQLAQKELEEMQQYVADNFTNKEGKIDFTLEGAAEATNIMIALHNHLVELETPAIMSVDLSSLDSAQLEAVVAIQNIVNAVNGLRELEWQHSVGISVDDNAINQAKQKVINTLEELKSTSEGQQIIANLGINTNLDGQELAQAIRDKVAGMSIEDLNAKLKLNLDIPNEDAVTVPMKVDGKAMDDWRARQENKPIKLKVEMDEEETPKKQEKIGGGASTSKIGGSKNSGGVNGTSQKLTPIKLTSLSSGGSSQKVKVGADTSSLETAVNRAQRVINRSEAKMPIDGDASQAQSEANSTKSKVETMNPLMKILGESSGATGAGYNAMALINAMTAWLMIAGNSSGAMMDAQTTQASINGLTAFLQILGYGDDAQGVASNIVNFVAGANPVMEILGNNSNATSAANRAYQSGSRSPMMNIQGNNSGAINSANSAVSAINGKSATIRVVASGISSILSQLSQIQSKTITVTANHISSGQKTFDLPMYSGSALSSHRVSGSAKAQGDWGVKQGGRTLVGELGEETIIRGSKYFTVGNNGAEFVNLRPNDIVLNHKILWF